MASVTIMMSNYNQGHYLEESLDGIFGQTRVPDEIIIVDDGSTDDSVAQISKYETRHKHCTLIRNKTNIGLQASVQKVLPMVRTDYLVWTAADDILLPTFVEKSMAAVERHPQAGLVFSELTVFQDNSSVTQEFAREPSVAHIYALNDLPEYCSPRTVAARMKRSFWPMTGNSVVARVDALLAVGQFHPQLHWHSDYFAYSALSVRYGACIVPETLTLLRSRDDSYSAKAMHDPKQQNPVLNQVMDLLDMPAYRDLKKTYREAPSFYAPWGTMILPLMARRIRYWPTFVHYGLRKLKEFKVGRNQSWKRLAGSVLLRACRKLTHAVMRRLNHRSLGREKEVQVAKLAALLSALAELEDGDQAFIARQSDEISSHIRNLQQQGT